MTWPPINAPGRVIQTGSTRRHRTIGGPGWFRFGLVSTRSLDLMLGSTLSSFTESLALDPGTRSAKMSGSELSDISVVTGIESTVQYTRQDRVLLM